METRRILIITGKQEWLLENRNNYKMAKERITQLGDESYILTKSETVKNHYFECYKSST